jgi:hypothetical protein
MPAGAESMRPEMGAQASNRLLPETGRAFIRFGITRLYRIWNASASRVKEPSYQLVFGQFIVASDRLLGL